MRSCLKVVGILLAVVAAMFCALCVWIAVRYRNSPVYLAMELSHAIHNGDPIRVKECLSEGADPNYVYPAPKPWLSSTPLHEACEKGDREIAQILVQAGADPNSGNDFGKTPLMWVLEYELTPGRFECFEYILDLTDDPDQPSSDGMTALHYACYTEEPRFAKALIEAGADVNRQSANGMTALHYACDSGAGPRFVEALIEAGADVNRQCAIGQTPLHSLCGVTTHEGDLAVLGLLLDAGADPTKLDVNSMSPIDLARWYNRHDLLLQFKLEFKERGEGGSP